MVDWNDLSIAFKYHLCGFVLTVVKPIHVTATIFFSSSSLQITWTTFVKYIHMQTNQLYVRLKCIAYANTPYPFKSTHKIVLLVIWGQRGKIMLHDFGAQFYWLLNVLLYAIDMTNSWSLFSHKYLITSVKIYRRSCSFVRRSCYLLRECTKYK